MHGENSCRLGEAVLQGTFETLALPEVLGLLAQSRKTGALWLEAGASSAVVYVADGQCCSALSNDAGEALDDAPSLLGRLVDICFAVSRVDDGSFRFGPEDPPWESPVRVDLDVAVDELGRLLEEWREIQAVIPSLDCRAKLAEELGVEELPVDRERWQLLVAIDGRRSVRELVRRTNRPVLEVCHALLGLVDAGAVAITQPPVPMATRTTGAGKATRATVEPEAPYGPGVESPHPGPIGNGDGDEGAPLEKGSYLRVFSGLRDA